MRPHQKAFPGIFVSLISLALSFFGATLSGGSAANAAGTSAGTISMPSATAGTVQNLGVKRIAVNRLGGSLGAASVHCSTANDTAVAGKDYTAVSDVITWASGDATGKWCNVPISDATPFTGDKTFYVKLSNPTGAPLGTYATTKVTIYGNKGAGLVSLSAATYTVAQNAGSVTITVNRTNGWAGAACVNYATANSTATAGTNYTSERGQLSWSNGDITPKKIVIPISKAALFTGTKKFAIAIAWAENVSLGTTTSAIVTIDGGAATTSTTTGTATLSWTAPTLYTNGTPITDLAGYNLYYGTSSTTMTKVIAINNPAASSYTISSLASGTWYFAIRAYDVQAVESELSTIVSKTI
jgi:hypothetical protein